MLNCSANCMVPPKTDLPITQNVTLPPLPIDVQGNIQLSKGSLMQMPAGSDLHVQDGSITMNSRAEAMMVGAGLRLDGPDARMKINNGSSLRMQAGSSFSATNGSRIEINDRSSMIVDQNSAFVVGESGHFQVARKAAVTIGSGSHLAIEGQMEGGGVFTMTDNSLFKVQPKGQMRFDKSVRFLRNGEKNCSLVNQGTMANSQSKHDKSYYDLPVENQGLMFMTNGKVHFSDFKQSKGWTILSTGVTLLQGSSSESNTTFNDRPLRFQGGFLQGNGRIQGDVIVEKNAHMNHDPLYGTNLEVQGDLDFAGTMWVNVNDQENPGVGYTKYSIKGKAKLREGAELYVCVKKKQKEGKLQILSWEGQEGAKFKLRLECENGTNTVKHRVSRDVSEADRVEEEDEEFDVMACPPSAEYTSSGLALLFATCTGGNDEGESLTIWVMSLCFIGGATVIGIAISILYVVHPPFRAKMQNSSGPSINQVLRRIETSQVRDAMLSNRRTTTMPLMPTSTGTTV
eukprot:TRINITY_DN2769_c0_g1_i1.p1 TRINITY_DN2769_c0_g1~~TRINITY_DN2769_c0_g1_i1.p1  ORF type:complete len:514 (-),score=113.14 TRINITY_DN2769_c0_g1_i1:1270-2811(-)